MALQKKKKWDARRANFLMCIYARNNKAEKIDHKNMHQSKID